MFCDDGVGSVGVAGSLLHVYIYVCVCVCVCRGGGEDGGRGDEKKNDVCVGGGGCEKECMYMYVVFCSSCYRSSCDDVM